MALVYSAQNVWTPLKATSLNGHLGFLLLLNQGIIVDITGNDGQTPLRPAASNFHLKVPQPLQSNSGIVHIARKCDLTAILAIICNFVATELLSYMNGNMALRSTGGTTAEICGYGNTDYDYTCDYLCHVTYSVV
jgi:ankyrin repeat protein